MRKTLKTAFVLAITATALFLTGCDEKANKTLEVKKIAGDEYTLSDYEAKAVRAVGENEDVILSNLTIIGHNKEKIIVQLTQEGKRISQQKHTFEFLELTNEECRTLFNKKAEPTEQEIADCTKGTITVVCQGGKCNATSATF